MPVRATPQAPRQQPPARGRGGRPPTRPTRPPACSTRPRMGRRFDAHAREKVKTMSIAETQKRIYVETVRAYEAKHGKTIAEMDAELETRLASQTGSSEAEKLKKIVADYRRKHPDEPPKVATEVGPQTRAAMKFAEALRRARQGQAVEASGNHKLEPFRVVG